MILLVANNAQAGAAQGKLTVAMVNPLSGDAATYGVSHKNGLELAFAEVNAAGGVKGQEIELLTHDDAGDPKQAAAGAQKFADQRRVLAIVGSCLSSNTLAMVPITDKAKLPHTAVSSSTPKLSGMSRYFFRMAVQDAQVGILMADLLAQKLKVKRVAILYPNNDYGKGLAAAIEGQLKHHGVGIVSTQAYLATDKDFSALLTGIKGSDADALAVAGTYTDGGLITKQIRGMGFEKPIVGGTGFYSPKFVEIADKAAEGAFFLGAFVATNPDPAVQQFVKKYKEKYGMEPDTFAALAYDQGFVLKAAIEKAAAAKGGITRESVRDAMAASNYKGITGTVTFDDKGDWVRPYLYITVKDGKFEVAR
jgi:branched-chain amino acid transport system substrate-binding protein